MTIQIDKSAGLESKMSWWGSLDDLIHFIYGNQCFLFTEDARLFEVDGDLVVMAERESTGKLVIGSWE